MPERSKNKKMEEDLQVMREWLSKQAHLPPKIDDIFIKRFLRCCNHSLEQTKNLMDLFYTLRSQAPEIFGNRDPEDPKLKMAADLVDLAPLPKLTSNNYKLFIYRLNDSDVDKFSYVDVLKVFFMVADIRIYTEDSESDGEVPIFDMGKLTLRHLTKVSLPILKKYMVYTQEAHPIRLKQIHVLNTAPFLDKCLALVKPFMKTEVAQMLHFHTPNSTTLFDYIPRDLIPEDYGGTLGKTVTDIKNEWIQRVEENREFFTNKDMWRVDEAKRPYNNKNNKQLYGMQGSFRSLTID